MSRTLAALAAWLWVVAAPAAELGDDGLHKAAWMQDTFKDLAEDLAEARAQDRRLLVLIEQRGCIYCTRMHEDVFPDPRIDTLLRDRFFVVQINMFGDVEVTDFDGQTLTEKAAVRKWGMLFTPTLVFFPEQVDTPAPADAVAVAAMPGAFGTGTTLDLLTWVLEHGYDGDEGFQKYHARMHAAREAEK